VFEEIPSTNAVIKEYAKQGAPTFTMAVAAAQSAGRGRGDHTFFSPKGTGVYLSILLRPACGFAPADVTATAAVAACNAIQAVCGVYAEIKWLNDIYVGGKKVAGILAECVITDKAPAVVLGFGVNLLPPKGGFPPEIAARAGAVLEKSRMRFLRERMAIAFFGEFEKLYRNGTNVYAAYRERSFLLGKRVIFAGQEATVRDLLPDFRLELEMSNGETRRLDSGEVSLPDDKIIQ
jgi:BirA family biotin operon repressor/biotin-[acetyl-CoA-carboxylase] ligase